MHLNERYLNLLVISLSGYSFPLFSFEIDIFVCKSFRNRTVIIVEQRLNHNCTVQSSAQFYSWSSTSSYSYNKTIVYLEFYNQHWCYPVSNSIVSALTYYCLLKLIISIDEEKIKMHWLLIYHCSVSYFYSVRVFWMCFVCFVFLGFSLVYNYTSIINCCTLCSIFNSYIQNSIIHINWIWMNRIFSSCILGSYLLIAFRCNINDNDELHSKSYEENKNIKINKHWIRKEMKKRLFLPRNLWKNHYDDECFEANKSEINTYHSIWNNETHCFSLISSYSLFFLLFALRQ